jgi:murein DD-endopeptidase MepM/ murein hydrolase activator NlpD
MFTATGAAMATSPHAQSVIPGQNVAAMTKPQPAVVDADLWRARPLRTIEPSQAEVRREQAVGRATAAARVTRSVARKKLAARAVEAKRAARAHNWQLPLSNPVKTSGFGFRWGRLHAGEDFAVSTGTDLVSMSTGTVDSAGIESGYGNLVKIRYWDGTVSYFAHMSSISVNPGEKVEPGEVVGQSGNTGHSTGPHLHLEIHPDGGEAVDPLPWLIDHNIAP